MITILLLLSIPLQSQDTLKWYALNSYFSGNSSVSVPIKCDGFEDIFAFQYGIKFDTNYVILDSVSISNVLPEFDLSNFGFNWIPPHLIPKNNMSVLWTYAYGYGVQNASQIFTLHFTTKQSGWLKDIIFPSTDVLVFECIDETMSEIPITFEVRSEIPVQNTTDIDDVYCNSITIYPNPIKNYLNVESNFVGIMKIFDSIGNLQFVFNINIGNNLLLIDNDPGLKFIYFLDERGNSITKKITKD